MLIPLNELAVFFFAALLMVITPGPNMIYLISRSICQGRKAGVLSLLGVVAAFLIHIVCTAAGLSALLFAVPFAYDALRWAGAAYLLYLAWQAVKPGGRSAFETRELPQDSPRKLFAMGFFTSLLNPKVAVFYLSIFPQFIVPERGSVFTQSLLLGGVQVTTSFLVNLLFVITAAQVSRWFADHPRGLMVQRYVMGFVLGALAVRLAAEQRKV